MLQQCWLNAVERLTAKPNTLRRRDLVREAASGRVSLVGIEAPPGNDQRRKSLAKLGEQGIENKDQKDLKDMRLRTGRLSFSSGMRDLTTIVRRNTLSDLSAPEDWGHSLSSQMDGQQFYVGLLMANLCDLTVPGTDRRFGDFAQPFWESVMFFPGLGFCLDAILQRKPWPLTEAIKQSSPEYNQEADVLSRRIGRLACSVLQCIIRQSGEARFELWGFLEDDDDALLWNAIERLVAEEPSASDLLLKEEPSMEVPRSPKMFGASRTAPGMLGRRQSSPKLGSSGGRRRSSAALRKSSGLFETLFDTEPAGGPADRSEQYNVFSPEMTDQFEMTDAFDCGLIDEMAEDDSPYASEMSRYVSERSYM